MIVSLDLVLLFVFYHPPPRSNSQGLSNREVLARIDFVGGLLSIGGIALFLLGLQWGGYTMYVYQHYHLTEGLGSRRQLLSP